MYTPTNVVAVVFSPTLTHVPQPNIDQSNYALYKHS